MSGTYVHGTGCHELHVHAAWLQCLMTHRPSVSVQVCLVISPPITPHGALQLTCVWLVCDCTAVQLVRCVVDAFVLQVMPVRPHLLVAPLTSHMVVAPLVVSAASPDTSYAYLRELLGPELPELPEFSTLPNFIKTRPVHKLPVLDAYYIKAESEYPLATELLVPLSQVSLLPPYVWLPWRASVACTSKLLTRVRMSIVWFSCVLGTDIR